MAGERSEPILFLVPGDPKQRTGGYRYVAQLVRALTQAGSVARVQGLEGRFPIPDHLAESAMEFALSGCADGAMVVLDGLAMGGLPDVINKHGSRLCLIALVHHPLADETGISDDDQALLFESEKRALAAVSRVITTSRHTAERLKDFNVSQDLIRVIEPGADSVSASIQGIRQNTAKPAMQSAESEELQILCVASLSPRKAQLQLITALAKLRHLPWHCTLAGSTERDAEYGRQVLEQIRNLDLGGRITVTGELEDEPLARQYKEADLFVLPSLYEGYGMVIDEAIAAGLPVITSDGGALASTGNRPGIRQYSAGSVSGLTECLETCLSDRQMLQDLTIAARQSAARVRQWSDAAREFERAIEQPFEQPFEQPPQTRDHSQFDQQWLLLREPADHRARNEALVKRLQTWMQDRSEIIPGVTDNRPAMFRIVDLGAGAGSNGVYISKALAAESLSSVIPMQHWTLLEQDPDLLAQASSRMAPGVAIVETCQHTIDADNLNDLIPDQTQLITASALIDLMSAPWLCALADAAAVRHAAVYIVLSYAGHFQLDPGNPDDDWIRTLVNDHQHGDKGSGAALGPEATAYLKDQLEARGLEVILAPSPWLLEGDERQLQAALIDGWCQAALEQCPDGQSRIEHWKASRLGLAEQGQLTVQVDHHDLFAWPVHD